MMDARTLVVVADDFGIGPATSRGIIRLCRSGVVTGTVLLVTSPFAAQAAEHWRGAALDADLGWHPCLTLDAPILPAREVPTLVDRDGRFHRLGGFLRRLMLGRIDVGQVADEFSAQLDRFRALTGSWPATVNAHHHVQVFTSIGAALRGVLAARGLRPYLRQVRESAGTLLGVPGARRKRAALTTWGRREGRRQAADGFAGNDWLLGIADPSCVHNPDFFVNWLRAAPRRGVVELTCHPGDFDDTLLGRDATPGDGNVERRPAELAGLKSPAFAEAVARGGFRLTRPTEVTCRVDAPYRRAA
jgi:predicted glycoside hydrolase/deacetylase ChbG (UPF0249 family)